MARKFVVAALLVVCLTMVSLGSAFAAQGTITEVNPSGIGKGKPAGVTVDTNKTPKGAKGVIADVNPSGSVKVVSPGRDDSGPSDSTGAQD